MTSEKFQTVSMVWSRLNCCGKLILQDWLPCFQLLHCDIFHLHACDIRNLLSGIEERMHLIWDSMVVSILGFVIGFRKLNGPSWICFSSNVSTSLKLYINSAVWKSNGKWLCANNKHWMVWFHCDHVCNFIFGHCSKKLFITT